MGAEDHRLNEHVVVAPPGPDARQPRARELFRRGAVYGLAGLLKASDVATAAARGAARGARAGAADAGTASAEDQTTAPAEPSDGTNPRDAREPTQPL